MKVSATGMPVARTNSRSAGAAPARTAPLPASATGFSAPRIRSAARSSSRAAGSGCTGLRRGSGPASTSDAITSSGSSMCVAPGFSDSATLNALRTTSGMIAASARRAFHFVIGRITSTMSMYWCDSLCIRSRSACPVRATKGARSRKASATAVTRLVAPGPSVPRQTPARPVSRPYTSAMYAPPCSWRTGTNSTEELASDSLRSSVSSPGIPKTCLTPSASRHSTNTSDALRLEGTEPRTVMLCVMAPAARYAKSGDVHIAYVVEGDAPLDMVWVPTWISQCEHLFAEPSIAALGKRLGRFARVVGFDRRGAGLSDPMIGAPTLEEQMDDVLAVMDAAGSERAAIFGTLEGGPLAALFAATYPERVQAMILYSTFARAT